MDRVEYPPIVDGVDTKSNVAIPVFKSINLAAVNLLKETSFVRGGETAPQDIDTLARLYRAVSFIAVPAIFNEGTQQHLILTGRYARLIGQHLNDRGHNYNLDTLESLGLLHDLGREFSHRRHRNDLVAHLILRNAGIRQDFIDRLPDDNKWMPIVKNGQIDEDATRIKMAGISLETGQYSTRGIIEVADALAKFVAGRLIKWSAIEEYNRKNQAKPNKRTMWPSEFIRQGSVIQHFQDGVDPFYKHLGAWLEQEIGMKFDDLVDEMEASLRVDPIKIFTSSKEKPILLHDIDAVIFDVGGVIITGGSTINTDNLIRVLRNVYQLPLEKADEMITICNQAFPKMQTGEFTDADLKKLLDQRFGKKSDESIKPIIEAAEDFATNPLMIATINNLKARGVRIILATNTIESTWKLLIKVLGKGGLPVSFVQTEGDISKDCEKLTQIEQAGLIPIFASFDLGVRKGGISSLSFFEAVSKITRSTADKTLIIDDREDYYKQALREGFRGYHFKDSWNWLSEIAGLNKV